MFTLAIRLNNRPYWCGEFTDAQIPQVSEAVRGIMPDLRQYARVLITATRENVTRIIYSH